MTIIHKAFSFPKNLTIGTYARQRAEILSQALAHFMTRRVSDFSTFTPRIQVLQILLDRAPQNNLTGGDGSKTTRLFYRVCALADYFNRVASAMELVAASDQLKAVAAFYDPSIIPAAAISAFGAGAGGIADLLSPAQLTLMLTHGMIDAGSKSSQNDTIATGRTLMGTTYKWAGEGNSALPAESVLDNLVAMRLCEFFIHHGTNVRSTEQSEVLAIERKEYIPRRTNLLRTLARELAAVAIGPAAIYVGEITKAMNEPWVRSAITGRTADALTRALVEFSTRNIDAAVRPAWSDITAPDRWDADMLGLSALFSDVPLPSVDAPIGPADLVHPLSRDLAYPVEFTHENAELWLELLYSMTGHVEEQYSRLILSEHATSIGFPAIGFDHATPSAEGAPVLLPQDGYPIIAPDADYTFWPSPATSPGSLGITQYIPVTYAGMREQIRTHFPRTPAFIHGLQEPSEFAGYAPIMPALGKIHEAVPRFPLTRENIHIMWGMSEQEFSNSLRVAGSRPSTLSLRAMADALRFIGVLAVGKGDHFSVVPTFDRRYYHASEIASSILGPSITLATYPVDGGEASVVLKPFLGVPQSARLELLGSNVQWLDIAEYRPYKRAAAWAASRADKFEPSLPITGIIAADPKLTDIVTVPSTGTGHELVLTGDKDRPIGRRYHNAVLLLDSVGGFSEYAAATAPALRVLLER